MIDDARTPAKPIAPRVVRLLWVAFLCGACGIAAIGHILKPEPLPPPNAMIGRLLAVVAAAEILIFAFIRRRFLNQAQEKKQRGEADRSQAMWGAAQILGFASALSIVLFGLVLHFVNASPVWISTAFFVAGLVNLAVYYPQPLPESR